MSEQLVSVIIPCYNMGRFIGEALESVAAQTHRNWEILAVDDCGPEDGTRETIEAFASQHPAQRVELIRHETNQGVSAARNTAIAAAKGNLLAFLDPDDLWLPRKLEMQLEAMQVTEGAVGCIGLGKIIRSGQDGCHTDSVEVMGYLPGDEAGVTLKRITSGEVLCPFSSVILEKIVVEKAGGFTQGLSFQNEDRLLLAAVAHFGKLVCVGEPICVYRIHDGSATSSVIRSQAVIMIELDLCFRVAKWLRKVPGGRSSYYQVILGPLRSRFSELRRERGLKPWRALILKHAATLVIASLRDIPYFVARFFRKTRRMH